MKNLILCLTALLVILSCANKETFEEKIQGEWLTYSFVINCQDENRSIPLTMAEEDGCIDFWGSTQCTTISFAPNGIGQVFTSYDGESIFSHDITYTLEEEKQLINICQDSGCSDIAFVDDRLVLIMDENECYCEFEYDRRD